MRIFRVARKPLMVVLALIGGFGASTNATAAVKMDGSPSRGPQDSRSFWVVTKTGRVCAAGSARTYGNGHGVVVGISGTSDGKGYWLVLAGGKTEAFGDAKKRKYRRGRLTKWSKTLGDCKASVVGAATASVKITTKPKSPSNTKAPSKTNTTPAVTPSTTTAPSSGSTQTGPGSTAPAPSTPAATSTNPPAPVTTSTAPPVTTTSPSATPPAPVSPTVATRNVPQGEVGIAYTTTLTASGGIGGYSWSIVGGALPPGLSLSAGGVLSGTPSRSGSYAFSAAVATSDGGTATEAYAVQVLSAVSVSHATLAPPEAGVAYSSSALSASGGTGAYSWRVSSGQLPAGLALDEQSGEILGSPTTSGTDNFVVTATDGNGSSSSRSLTLTVASPVSISTTEIPDPVATLSYDQQLSATAGTGGDTWSLAGGSLPDGVSLTSGGEIMGTPTPGSTGSDLGLPTAGGSYSFTAQVTDSAGGTSRQSYTVLVAAYNNVDGQGQTWSGYTQVGAGAYTSVTGTFTVPVLVPESPPEGFQNYGITSEWVGIDGDGNNSLIQAGLDSSYTANGDLIQAWTEYITNGNATDVETNVPNFRVSPGDSVTVTITKTDPATSTWTTVMTDDTTGQTYQTSTTYPGAGQTAEWIVEAPRDASTGHIDSTALFFNTIDFTNLRASQPAVGQQYMSFMEDNGGFGGYGDEMNSLLDSNGFAVDDTGEVPPPL